MSPPTPNTLSKPILTELITQLKNTREYKSTLKSFKEFIDKKDRIPRPVHYYLYYDLDDLKIKMGSEYDITYNSIVLNKAVVPERGVIKKEKEISDYQFEWISEGKKT